jgi:hypothetical protein
MLQRASYVSCNRVHPPIITRENRAREFSDSVILTEPGKSPTKVG